MSRLGMLVEGTTEVEFVKRVLAQPLRDRGVAATPVSMDGDVGLAMLHAECRRFGNWMDRLERPGP